MKKISLNKARKYENKLKNTFNYISVHTKFNIFDPNISAEYIKTELREQNDKGFLPNLEKIKLCITYRFTLRRLIQNTNNSCGITKLLTEKNEAEQFVSILSNIIDEIEPMLELRLNDPDIIFNMIKKQSENSYEDAINGLTPNKRVIEDLKLVCNNYKVIINKCDDELELLNATTQIEISDELHELVSTLI